MNNPKILQPRAGETQLQVTKSGPSAKEPFLHLQINDKNGKPLAATYLTYTAAIHHMDILKKALPFLAGDIVGGKVN